MTKEEAAIILDPETCVDHLQKFKYLNGFGWERKYEKVLREALTMGAKALRGTITAYAYPPAHIDREAWEECESCRTCVSCLNSIVPYGESPCKECSFREKECYEPRNFCPACGKPLTDEAVDMMMERLEALKDG